MLAKGEGQTEGDGAARLVNEAARLWHYAKSLLWKWDYLNLNSDPDQPNYSAAYKRMGWEHEIEEIEQDKAELAQMDKEDSELREKFYAQLPSNLAFFRDGESVPKEDRFKTHKRLFEALSQYAPAKKQIQKEEPLDESLLKEFLAWRKKERAETKRRKRAKKKASKQFSMDAPIELPDKAALKPQTKRTKHSKSGAKTDTTPKAKRPKRT